MSSKPETSIHDQSSGRTISGCISKESQALEQKKFDVTFRIADFWLASAKINTQTDVDCIDFCTFEPEVDKFWKWHQVFIAPIQKSKEWLFGLWLFGNTARVCKKEILLMETYGKMYRRVSYHKSAISYCCVVDETLYKTDLNEWLGLTNKASLRTIWLRNPALRAARNNSRICQLRSDHFLCPVLCWNTIRICETDDWGSKLFGFT